MKNLITFEEACIVFNEAGIRIEEAGNGYVLSHNGEMVGMRMSLYEFRKAAHVIKDIYSINKAIAERPAWKRAANVW